MNSKEISDHNKIITEVAKNVLKPAGLLREGQSRTWLDDHGWFTIIFEYQPSGYSKGTYLNVGINFHWYKNDYFSFDYGSREKEFVAFRNPEQFSEEVINLTSIGLEKVFEYRKFRSLVYAREKIISYKFTSNALWGNYHRALVCFLTKDINRAITYLGQILSIESEILFVQELKENARMLIRTAKNEQLLWTHIMELIKESRAIKKLPAIELTDFQ